MKSFHDNRLIFIKGNNNMKPRIFAVALLSALSASPVMAGVYSSASLSNFTLSLVDLDLNDGVAPSISFQQGFENINNFVSGPNPDAKLFNGQNLAPISVTSTNGDNTANSNIFGSSISNFNISVSGETLSPVPYAGDFNYGYFAIASVSNYFTLSPNTSVNFTISSVNYMQTTEGTGASTDAFTISRLDARGYNLVNDTPVNSIGDVDRYSFNALNFEGGVDFTLNELTLLSVTLNNKFDSPLNGVLFSDVHTAGNIYYETPSAVPVPAALPLMATALGIFGIGAKRRKASKA